VNVVGFIMRIHLTNLYRVIHKSLRNFWTRLRNNQDRHSRKDISSTCREGQKLGASLPLLTCSPSAWPSRLVPQRSEIPEGLTNYPVLLLGVLMTVLSTN